MSTSIFRKGGIPALASSLFDHAASSCLGSLVVRVSEASRQATIELHFDVPVQGSNTPQRVRLVYDGDNLEPGAATVGDASVSPARMMQIARAKGGKPMALNIVLKRPCIVLLSPGTTGSANAQLAVLAKATRLTIVFDHGWLHPDKAVLFDRLVYSSGLTGFARPNARLVTETDWTVFGPGGEQSPPPYQETSLKRSRQLSGSPEPRTPKRVLHDNKVEIEVEISGDPGSPTEKATTTTAVSSPRLLSSPPPDAVDPFQTAVEAALAKMLPGALREVLPEVLPSVLRTVFAVPPPPSTSSTSSSLSPPPYPHAPQTTSSPPPKSRSDPTSSLLSPLRAYLSTHAAHLAEQISRENFAHALSLHDTASLELEERLCEHRSELALLREDGLMEIHRVCDAKLELVEERAREIVDTVETETAECYTQITRDVDDYVEKRRGEVARDVLRDDRERHAAVSDRRARSVPLDLG